MLQSASTTITITKSVESHDERTLESLLQERHSAIDKFIFFTTLSYSLILFFLVYEYKDKTSG